jgi:ABC-type ATPase involved in cell division
VVQGNDASGQRLVVGVDFKVAREAPINLQGGNQQALEIARARVADAKTINGQADGDALGRRSAGKAWRVG